ncbi:hypothetical protein F2Q69_00036548 [Brassica cretica]|uniref:Uncharacterized protein n=1 Tax=Brassica cretica TaxID=69181 RepID=A0A8S9SLZ7_BRACR|nr:hypothetical protein F2Q69_00036548 [Brassica cretica]
MLPSSQSSCWSYNPRIHNLKISNGSSHRGLRMQALLHNDTPSEGDAESSGLGLFPPGDIFSLSQIGVKIDLKHEALQPDKIAVRTVAWVDVKEYKALQPDKIAVDGGEQNLKVLYLKSLSLALDCPNILFLCNQQETRINPGGANNETTPPKLVPAFLMLSRENFHVVLSPLHHAVSRLHAIKLPTLVLA